MLSKVLVFSSSSPTVTIVARTTHTRYWNMPMIAIQPARIPTMQSLHSARTSTLFKDGYFMDDGHVGSTVWLKQNSYRQADDNNKPPVVAFGQGQVHRAETMRIFKGQTSNVGRRWLRHAKIYPTSEQLLRSCCTRRRTLTRWLAIRSTKWTAWKLCSQA